MSPESPSLSRRNEIPAEIRSELADTLTERGMGQWWEARNRLLDGFSPAACWTHEPNRRRVLGAAKAFAEGVYV